VKFHNGEEFTAESVKFTLGGVQDAARSTRQAPDAAFKEVR
jgi:ABC-type transport system substrate-binding protein